IRWLKQAHASRYTVMVYNDYISEGVELDSRLDQGNLSSSILFIIYNTGLIEVTWDANLSVLFIDDSALLYTGRSFQETH
ncbi:hypothetical protein BDQ17DRAFT_1267788, partial [Cyathus striatus]